MAFYQVKYSQVLPASMEEVWKFIASPTNLKHITPPSMGFEVLTKDLPEKMHAGMIIAYNVRPLFGINTPWVTEITRVEDGVYFVDEQRMGPYKMWHHQHRISPVKEGVLMEDTITYIPPFGFIGAIANKLIIESKLKEIFEYRRKKLEERF